MPRARALSFSYFVLSDTNNPAVAAAEEKAVEAWKAADPDGDRIVYRRREQNTAFKAGNVHDFCERWGRDFALMLPLDADSLMAGPEIVRMVRMMQAHPKIGILQSLVVGMPSSSGFRAHLPVRHAPRHALLHHGAGLVGRRLRPVLGPQRAGAHQAVPRAVRPADPVRQAAARRPRALARPGGGDPDAPRRLRGARAAGRARQLGGEPADHARVRPARRALVPGQHAVHQAARPAGALSHEPLPARVGDPDVHRHPRLDADDRAAAGGGMAGAEHCGLSGQARHRPLHHVLHHVPDAEDRRASSMRC